MMPYMYGKKNKQLKYWQGFERALELNWLPWAHFFSKVFASSNIFQQIWEQWNEAVCSEQEPVK